MAAQASIIVALDCSSGAEALAFAERVRPADCRLKVGLELYGAAGPQLVRTLVQRGFEVFLDLKFHDIPNTVARACRQAAELGVWMLNVHCLGGARMLEAARTALAAPAPLLVGVTLLTSHAPEELAALGLAPGLEEQVERLARLAHAAGLDGVVCSAHEAPRLRSLFGSGFRLVTPGIRPAGTQADDQRRFVTPAEAVRRGADYLVIGRPITRAADPAAELARVRQELGAAAPR